MVQEGWFRDSEAALIEALRRFLDSHHPDLQRLQILNDAEWGLRGRD